MFRFTIRELLMLTLVVALCTGWVIDRWRLSRHDAWAVERAALWQKRAAIAQDLAEDARGRKIEWQVTEEYLIGPEP
jgi:hypothetical protein